MPLYPEAPGAPNYAAPLLDFSPIGKLADDVYKGAENRRDYQLKRAFQDGLPVLPGTNIPDIGAMAQTLARLGGIDNAVQLANAAAGQQAGVDASNFLVNGGMAPPGGAPSTGTEPRGIRNNNPGNIENGSFAAGQPGYAGAETKGRFATFGTMDQGIGAASNLLASYGQRGINTVQGVIERWAPKADGNNTQAYAASVAKSLGVAPDAPIDLSKPEVRSQLARAMFAVENGKPVGAGAGGQATIPAHGIPKGSGEGGQQPLQPQPGAPVRVAGPAPQAAAAAQTAPPAAPAAPMAEPASPAAPQPAGAQTSDPTLGGLIPRNWIAQGGTAETYLNALDAMAARPNIAGNAKDALLKRAEAIRNTIAKWNEPTPELKNYRADARPGETMADYQARVAGAKSAAEVTPEQKIYKQAVEQGFKGTELQFHAMREQMKGDHFKVIYEDPISGVKQYGFVDPVTRKVFDVYGKPISEGASGAGGGIASAYLAKGVTTVDQELTADDYLKQFSPEVQAAVKNFIDGKSTPTGNARKGYAELVKRVAQKYGADTGVQADDTTFAQRRQFRNQLASGNPASVGGQRNSANTALEHLSEVADLAVELNNSDWYFTHLSRGVNSLRGLTTAQQAKVNAYHDALQRYGAEITKFYAGSTGGVEERKASEERLGGTKAPQEIAAALEAERGLLFGKVRALELQRDSVLGPAGPDVDIMLKNGREALTRLDKNIGKLRGGKSDSAGHGAPPAPAAGGAQAAAAPSVPSTGIPAPPAGFELVK